jgi:large subunit ribosomal protein L4
VTEINVLNNKFENKEKMKLGIALTPELINVPVVHQAVIAILASRRQGNAHTKTKAEVSGGGKKPFKQKGTGNARQGSSRSPLMPGGGTVFGPRKRSFEQKVNKKVMVAALKSIIADKFCAGKLIVTDTISSTGKTKELHTLLKQKNLLNCLVVPMDAGSLAIRAVKNIATAKGLPVDSLSVYEAVKYENLIIEKQALEKLVKNWA